MLWERRAAAESSSTCAVRCRRMRSLGPNGPDFLLLEWRLLAEKTALVPGIAMSAHVRPFQKRSRCACEMAAAGPCRHCHQSPMQRPQRVP